MSVPKTQMPTVRRISEKGGDITMQLFSFRNSSIDESKKELREPFVSASSVNSCVFFEVAQSTN